MKDILHKLVRVIALLALMASSAIAFAQDESDTENVEYPFIGVRYSGVDGGILVTGVISNTPAATADIEAGDVISAIDESPIDLHSIREVLFALNAGDEVALSIDRDGEAHVVDLTLMTRPEDMFENPDYVIPLDLASVGLFVAQCADKVMVIGALSGTQMAEAGFHTYDILTSVDGEPIVSIGEADVAISDLSEGDELRLTVMRGEQELVIKTVVVDHRRRNPRHRPRPRPRPRLEVSNSYVTDSIELGYGENAIEIQSLGVSHEWYANGLRQYDLIVAANGAPLAEANELFATDTIELTVERVDGTLRFDVPASTAPLLMFGLDAPKSQEHSEWLGLHEKQVTLGVRYIQLEDTSPYFEGSEIRNGAYVAEVIEGLPAAAAGVQLGDIIVAVAGEPATLEIDLRNRIYFHAPGDTVTLDVLREGELIQIQVELRVSS